jgi:hypothetical protein
MKNLAGYANRIADLHESTMCDLCLINTSGSYTDSYGQIITSASSSASSICGCNTQSGQKRYLENETWFTYDAVIRLPEATAINKFNTITVTSQGGQTTNQTYKIQNLSLAHAELIAKCEKLEV